MAEPKLDTPEGVCSEGLLWGPEAADAGLVAPGYPDPVRPLEQWDKELPGKTHLLLDGGWGDLAAALPHPLEHGSEARQGFDGRVPLAIDRFDQAACGGDPEGSGKIPQAELAQFGHTRRLEASLPDPGHQTVHLALPSPGGGDMAR